jgi:hypothetical protein
MNPVTFNEKFLRAIEAHPESETITQIFGKWQISPLFDETTCVFRCSLA